MKTVSNKIIDDMISLCYRIEKDILPNSTPKVAEIRRRASKIKKRLQISFAKEQMSLTRKGY